MSIVYLKNYIFLSLKYWGLNLYGGNLETPSESINLKMQDITSYSTGIVILYSYLLQVLVSSCIDYTGTSIKTQTQNEDFLKNTVFIELHNVNVCDRYVFHHILTKIE